MARKKKYKKKKKIYFPSEIKQGIWAILLILASILISLSFFGKAGTAGNILIKNFHLIIGEAIFISPLIFILAALVFIKNVRNVSAKKEKFSLLIAIAILSLFLGLSAILGIFDSELKQGGWLGFIISWPFLKFFGFWASFFIFLAFIAVGVLIFWHFLRFDKRKDDLKEEVISPSLEQTPSKSSIIKKIFSPKFKTEEIFPPSLSEEKTEKTLKAPENKPTAGSKIFTYSPPPLDLLEKEHGSPTSGDIGVNSAIIKKTLQNFGIEVVMSEVNIGPTVTQYTFKPAEGIKLSKITALSNDLSLALASHPIRIEAPVPGRSVVGVEIPNKVRAQVKLRSLIASSGFQKAEGGLIVPLGKDVAGFPFYADLTKMPHLLVAGATGTGKTIFLSSLIMSLLYQPSTSVKSASPANLRFIMVDPKRVEFPIYSDLPHLLCPIIYNANQTINVLKWLIAEMERRFDVLAEAKTRNIDGFNQLVLKSGEEPMPYIILIIDELADLMAAKGREIESGIVRLAQMARAVGIHLVLATQRPSVEVITGLIKANITSRVTFQVASQVDSRTVLDSSGAEKLLGAGDMLFVSAQVPKPKRIQSAFISEKEIKKVVNYIKSNNALQMETEMDSELISEIEEASEYSEQERKISYDTDQDPLFEEAKKVVIELKRASASLLQRRLRLGYARAARLIDMLEEKGIVGPAKGAKPREVYGETRTVGLESENMENMENMEEDEFEDNKGEWKKV